MTTDTDPDETDEADDSESTFEAGEETVDEKPPVNLPEPGDGEWLANKADTADTFGGYRHICNDPGDGTYVSLCDRKKAPRHIVGRSLELVDAFDLLLNDIDVCPTCAKRAGVEAHIDWGAVRDQVRRNPDAAESVENYVDAVTAETGAERIPVRAEFNVEIDFPASAKADLIEVARDVLKATNGSGLGALAPSDMEEAEYIDAAPIEVEEAE